MILQGVVGNTNEELSPPLRWVLVFLLMVYSPAFNGKTEYCAHSMRIQDPLAMCSKHTIQIRPVMNTYSSALSSTGARGGVHRRSPALLMEHGGGGLFVYWQRCPRWGHGSRPSVARNQSVSLGWPLRAPVISPKDGRCVLFNPHC